MKKLLLGTHSTHKHRSLVAHYSRPPAHSMKQTVPILLVGLVPATAFWITRPVQVGSRSPMPHMRSWRDTTSTDSPYGAHAHTAFTGTVDSINRDADLVFACLDKDGDGGVSKQELLGHLELAGYDASEVSVWFDMDLDKDANGLLTKEELRQAFHANPELQTAPALGTNLNGETPQAVRMDATNFIFEADTAREGFITVSEMQTYMHGLGFAAKAVDHVFAELDLDSDGTISRDEMAELFLKHSALRLALRKT